MRKLKEINRFIYITSNLRPPVKNLLDLACTDSKSGFEGLDPFVVKEVVPLDLAPHALRCDLVILCERLKPEEIPKPSRPPPKKNVKKNYNQQKKTPERSNFFPAEEMVRRYSSVRKPKQDIDYQKRDSLYPLPLRGALYQGYENEAQSYYSGEGYAHRSVTNHSMRTASHNRDLDRYYDFRRDMEDALDETAYYSPRKQLTSRKLAYANALLEEGIRLASEVLDNDYSRMPSSTRSHGRQNLPSRRNKYQY